MADQIEEKKQRVEQKRQVELAQINSSSFGRAEYVKKRNQGDDIYKTRDYQKERNRRIDQQIKFERFGILPDDDKA